MADLSKCYRACWFCGGSCVKPAPHTYDACRCEKHENKPFEERK